MRVGIIIQQNNTSILFKLGAFPYRLKYSISRCAAGVNYLKNYAVRYQKTLVKADAIESVDILRSFMRIFINCILWNISSTVFNTINFHLHSFSGVEIHSRTKRFITSRFSQLFENFETSKVIASFLAFQNWFWLS